MTHEDFFLDEEWHVTDAQVADFRAGRLNSEARGRLQGHLLGCSTCSTTFAEVLTKIRSAQATASDHKPMPRPPAEILESLGLYDERTGFNLTAIRTLAEHGVGWAQEELKRLLELLLQWTIIRTYAAKRGASLTRGTHKAQAWPEQISVEIANAHGQSGKHSVKCQVLEPPTLLPSGAVRLVVRTDDERVVGGGLQCQIALGTEATLTVTGEWVPEIDNWGWQAWIEESGFPTTAAPHLILPELVQWSLHQGEQATVASSQQPLRALPSMFAPLTEQYQRTLRRRRPMMTTQSQENSCSEPLAIQVWVQRDAEDAIDTVRATTLIPTFQVGHKIRIGYSVSRDAYVYIFEIDTVGVLSHFALGSLRKSNKGDERRRYLVPHPDEETLPDDERFDLPLNGPAGREVLVAIASETALPIIEKWKFEGRVATTELPNLFAFLTHLPHDSWAIAQCQIDVTE